MKDTLKEIAGMLTILAVVITWPWVVAVWFVAQFISFPVLILVTGDEEKAKVPQTATDTVHSTRS